MGKIRRLNLQNYREYVSEIQKLLLVSDEKEQELFDFIEDIYNSIEDDNKASAKCIIMLEESVRFSIKEKIFGGCLVILQDLKSSHLREQISNRNFKNKFDDDEDDDLEIEDDE